MWIMNYRYEWPECGLIREVSGPRLLSFGVIDRFIEVNMCLCQRFC